MQTSSHAPTSGGLNEYVDDTGNMNHRCDYSPIPLYEITSVIKRGAWALSQYKDRFPGMGIPMFKYEMFVRLSY